MNRPSSDQPTQALPNTHVGLRCQRCGHGRLRVLYTRPRRDGTVLRRRACQSCGTRLTTWERAIGTGRPAEF